MTADARRPRLFIGSAVESLAVAYSTQENLEYDAECTVWTQGVFRPTRQALEELLNAMHSTDFAVFVFTADDVVKMRGTEYAVARDNIVFELGLFIGHLGPERCFMVAPRSSVRDLHLPSDLLGLLPLTFDDGRSDNNLLGALGTACNSVAQTALSEPETEQRAREVFAQAVVNVWRHAFTYFAPLSSASPDEAWGEDLPPIALVARRWST